MPLPLVEIHTEARQRARACIRAASRSEGQALVVKGDAGMGKSTILSEAMDSAEPTIRLLHTMGHDTEVEASFAGLSRLLWPCRDQVERLDEQVAARVRATLGIGPAVPGDRFAVAGAVLELLSCVGPATCIVDDWHVLDIGSRSVLSFVARRLTSTSISMLIATRPPASQELEGLPFSSLRPLEHSDLDALARSWGTPLPGSIIDELLEATGGNTLAVVEAGQHLDCDQRAGRSPIGTLSIGDPLLRSFAEPLEKLSEVAVDVLRVVALCADGDRLVVDRALRRLGRSDPALPVDEIASFVDIDEHVMKFRHPLRRAAVVSATDDQGLRRVHRAIGEALLDLGNTEAAAVHLASGTAPPDESMAKLLEAAANRSTERSDLAQASIRFERAASFSENLNERARRLLQSATCAAQAGRPADDLFRRAGLMGRDPALVEQALVMRSLAASWRGDHDQVLVLADDAVRDGSRKATWAAATLLGMGCFIAWNRTDLAAFGRYWAALRGLAPELDLTSARGPQLIVLVELIQFGVLVEGSDLDEALLELLLRRIVTEVEVDLAPTAVFMLLTLDRHEEAAALAKSLRRLASHNGSVASSTWLDVAEAFSLEMNGRPLEAHELALETMGAADAITLTWATEVCRSIIARCAAIRGDLDGVRAQLEFTDDNPSYRILALGMRASLGLCLLGRGEVDAAADQLMRLRGDAASASANPFFHRLHADLVECLVRTGEPQLAQEVANEFARNRTPVGGRISDALMARIAGMTEPPDAATACFEAALMLHQGHPDAFEYARTQLAFGMHLRRLQQPSAALAQFTVAAATFERLGARPWVDNARHQARLAGGRSLATKPLELGPLTLQERAVIDEVARGRRNREIAAVLFISTKTVEAHLTRIYRKLGLRSRTELVRWTTSDQQK